MLLRNAYLQSQNPNVSYQFTKFNNKTIQVQKNKVIFQFSVKTSNNYDITKFMTQCIIEFQTLVANGKLPNFCLTKREIIEMRIPFTVVMDLINTYK